LGVLKKDGTEYEPDSLVSMFNSLDRYLRNLKSPIKVYPELTNFEKRLESINMMDAGLEVDADAMDVYPNDVPDPRALFPCKVDAADFHKFHLVNVSHHVII
jgi:hypothetical protein